MIKLPRANVGCGRTAVPGWYNFDNSYTVRLARYGPVLKGLHSLGLCSAESLESAIDVVSQHISWADATVHIPLPNETLDVLYSSHMLEHLRRDDVRRFLSEARRVLKPQAIIRLVVPDLSRRVQGYLEHGDADGFVESLNMETLEARTFMSRVRLALVGPRRHQWMYDSRSLIALLHANGFLDAREMPPGTTRIKDPVGLNLRERADESIYVEALRDGF